MFESKNGLMKILYFNYGLLQIYNVYTLINLEDKVNHVDIYKYIII
jgi:hypothetical protein